MLRAARKPRSAKASAERYKLDDSRWRYVKLNTKNDSKLPIIPIMMIIGVM
jgi:hypothetical protein